MSEQTYRVGQHQAQNVYRGEQYIGVMFAPEDAALTVSMLNSVQPIKAVTGLLECAEKLIGQDRWLLLRNKADGGCGWCGRDHLVELRRVSEGAQQRSGEPVALVDRMSDWWGRVDQDAYQLHPNGPICSRAYIEDTYGPLTEVWS